MRALQRVAFIGNHLPRRCGIATFTHDLHRAVSTSHQDLETCVVAMTNPGCTYDYPPAVRFQVREEMIDDYAQGAEFLNNASFDVVSLQHEYGIFGGEAGGNIIDLLSRLEMPVVTTLHTVLANTTPIQRDVMRRIIDTSAKIVIMSETGSRIPPVRVMTCQLTKLRVIPHGIPDFPFLETAPCQSKIRFRRKDDHSDFRSPVAKQRHRDHARCHAGILSNPAQTPSMLFSAQPSELCAEQGEAYRDCLTARVQDLGIGDHVVFSTSSWTRPHC